MGKAKAKGTRNERRSRALLESLGYVVTRAAGSLGAWDLVGIGPSDVVVVQVKTNRPPSQAERQVLVSFAFPANCRRLLHVWYDRQPLPRIEEL